MTDHASCVRRITQVVEFSDADSLVTVDEYDGATGKRSARTIYRTSSAPEGMRSPLARYLLAPELPAILAVLPDVDQVVTIARDTTGLYHLTLWRSLIGDTNANAIGTSSTPELADAVARAASLFDR